ncbi:hypothetical protein KQX54_014314 [Cotesia glomerata]|uniref:Homeobox domain-containing protein n=1 Tax=Cotesia glomerata TaxID=32391 RepID=A0AAV7ITZ3_COTGL|nr:hypothetical protein KQX54_014314 [Cotesia glomerata]
MSWQMFIGNRDTSRFGLALVRKRYLALDVHTRFTYKATRLQSVAINGKGAGSRARGVANSQQQRLTAPLGVKVWFQNRRTKHKRVQQEEEAKAQQQSGGNNNSNGNGNNIKNTHHVSKWQQETGDYHPEDDEDDDSELIDPKAEDCSSGSEA